MSVEELRRLYYGQDGAAPLSSSDDEDDEEEAVAGVDSDLSEDEEASASDGSDEFEPMEDEEEEEDEAELNAQEAEERAGYEDEVAPLDVHGNGAPTGKAHTWARAVLALGGKVGPLVAPACCRLPRPKANPAKVPRTQSGGSSV